MGAQVSDLCRSFVAFFEKLLHELRFAAHVSDRQFFFSHMSSLAQKNIHGGGGRGHKNRAHSTPRKKKLSSEKISSVIVSAYIPVVGAINQTCFATLPTFSAPGVATARRIHGIVML